MSGTDQETKAQAVALVRSGLSQVQAAKELGVKRASVGRWCRQAEAERNAQANGEQEPSDEPSLHDRAEDWKARILDKYDLALEKALARTIKLLPNASIREAVGAISVIADKRALATGNPTSIVGESIVIPEGGSIDDAIAELDRLAREVPAEEEARKEAPETAVEATAPEREQPAKKDGEQEPADAGPDAAAELDRAEAGT